MDNKEAIGRKMASAALRRRPGGGSGWSRLLRAAMIALIFWGSGWDNAAATTKLQEHTAMSARQEATASLKTIPPLDASQPARVETFAFGLG